MGKSRSDKRGVLFPKGVVSENEEKRIGFPLKATFGD